VEKFMNLNVEKFGKLFLLFVFAALLNSYAQKPNYKFKSIKQSDGLINSTINSMFEDSFGFIWIGTQQGIQCYDGKSFKNYQISNTDSSGLAHNFIIGFGEDSDNNIWICTLNGLSKYDRVNDKIERIILNKKIIEQNKANIFSALIQDVNDPDILWIVGNGILKLNIKRGKTEYFPYENMKNINYYSSYLYWIKQHPLEEDLLLTGSADLLSFNKKTGEFKKISTLEQNSKVPNNLILDLAVDPANSEIVWMATGDNWGRGSLGGLIRYNLISHREKIYTVNNRPNELTEVHLMKLCFYDNDRLWIGARNSGAFLYNKSEDKFYNYSKSKYNPDSFGTAIAVISIIKDRSGVIWFGSWGAGLSLLSPTSQKFSHFKSTFQDDPKFISTDVTSFAEDEEGNIWIGTYDAGLSKYYPKENRFEHFFEDFYKPGNDPIKILALLFDSKNNLWIGTHNNALYRYNPKNKSRIHYPMGIKKNNVSQNRINTLTELKLGEIVIATYGGGLSIYNYSTDSFIHYLNDPNDSTSISDNQIWGSFSDREGNYYFSGNTLGELIKFDHKTKKFSTYPELDISTFIAASKNHSGNYYINDVSLGLREIYLGDTISIQNLYDDRGQSIDNVESILVDSDRKLWMGTGNGIIEYDPELNSVKNYGIEDGLNGYEFNRIAAFKASTGEMYFGGPDGFSFFHPNKIKLSNYKPSIVFVDFKLFSKGVQIGENSVLKKNILLVEELELEYNQNDFTITYSALDFSNPDKINYKYTLENHDEEWIDAGHKNYASYTNMDPGKYTFKVLATNSDGVWLSEPKKISIIILPPLWKTSIAYIMYGLFFILGVFGIDRFQRKRLLSKEKTASQIREAELRAQLAESENERKSKELEEARNLQLSMLPKELPMLPNYDIAAYINTATEVGGDYYDFHVHLDGTLTVIIGDATGHGMQSGMMVSIIKSLFMSDRSNKGLVPFFQNTNKAIKDMQLGRLLMSLASVQFNVNSIKLIIAGMPPIYHFKNSSKTVDEISTSNFPLGAMALSNYNLIERNIEPGDTFLLMSDGFPELRNKEEEMIGYKRTRNLFEDVAEKSPDEIIMHLKENSKRWLGDNVADDDVTFVVIKVK
jgi:serine phosphatase RsbU (regulator of sigma subunit)/ligand-binding sensor domain-containing protein